MGPAPIIRIDLISVLLGINYDKYHQGQCGENVPMLAAYKKVFGLTVFEGSLVHQVLEKPLK